MCGRYASSRRPTDLIEEFEVDESLVDTELPADFNVAPTKPVYAVLERPAKPDRPQVRQLRVLTWGLIPSWAKEPSIGNRLINARLETLAEKPAFRRAFAARRCLLPADGYYEWYATQELVKGKPRKQPFFIHPADSSTLPMAGLYEIWRDPTKADDAPDRFRWTCTVVTTSATDELGHIHDRMPVMVTPESRDAWLDPTTPAEVLTGLVTPASPGLLTAYPVVGLVSNVANNGPELLTPLPLAPAHD